jgi:hypothetical protein
VESPERRHTRTDRETNATRVVRRHWHGQGPLFSALATVILALCGCATTTVTASRATPSPVALHLNAGGYSLSGSSTTIRGTVARGAKVRVNGHRASVHAGHWSSELHLHLGGNRVTVEATLSGHETSRKMITVTREKTPGEVEAETRATAPTSEAGEQEGSARQSTPARTPPPEETCTNGTYVNSAGNTVCSPEQSPTVPAGATAECEDGTYSFSQSRSGTCSHHGGVAKWL